MGEGFAGAVDLRVFPQRGPLSNASTYWLETKKRLCLPIGV